MGYRYFIDRHRYNDETIKNLTDIDYIWRVKDGKRVEFYSKYKKKWNIYNNYVYIYDDEKDFKEVSETDVMLGLL